MDVEHTRIRLVVAPDVGDQLLAGQHLAGVAHKEQKQLILPGRQFDEMTVPAYLPRAWFQKEVGVLKWLLRGGVTAKHGMNPGDQLLEGKRLGDVVVGPQVERGYFVGD